MGFKLITIKSKKYVMEIDMIMVESLGTICCMSSLYLFLIIYFLNVVFDLCCEGYSPRLEIEFMTNCETIIYFTGIII